VATSKAKVLDLDPAWDPHRGAITFTRSTDSGSEILYVVPGVGRQPDGAIDQGIMVKDPIVETLAPGTRDHVPAWMSDGNLLFSRTHACIPGPDCPEDIVLLTFKGRIGDYIVPTNEPPTTISAGWRDVRSISVDPSSDERLLVTGRNVSRDQEFGVWIIDGRSESLLPGSGNATYAIFTSDRRVVAIEQGSQADWGPAILVWSTLGSGSPQRIDAATVLSRITIPGVTSPDRAEFRSISRSPLDDGRFAVLVSDPAATRVGALPAIVILDDHFEARQIVESLPPKGQTWKTLIALGW
jgi:hypothetical protein